MGEARLHQTVLTVAVQPKEQMAELVGEDPPESDPQGVLFDSRRFLPIPATLDCPSHLLRPERHSPGADVGVAQTVIVKVPAASADDRCLGPRKNHDHRRRGGQGLAGRELPLKSDSSRLEQTIRFRERPLERSGRKLHPDVDRKLDGERRAQKKREHDGKHSTILP
jgi:hypothetical protein